MTKELKLLILIVAYLLIVSFLKNEDHIHYREPILEGIRSSNIVIATVATLAIKVNDTTQARDSIFVSIS